VLDRTLAIEVDSERICEAGHQVRRHLNGCLHDNRVIAEVVINTDSPCIVILHCIIDTISNVTLAVSWSHVVRKLTLHEICSSTLSIPLDQIFCGMLAHETIHCHIIAIDDSSVGTWIVAIDNASSTNRVISTPQPKIVTDHVTRVDLEHAVRLHSRSLRTTNSHGDILDDARI